MVSLKKRMFSHLENSEQGRAEAAANSIETDNQARAQQLDNTTRLQKLPGEISQATAKEAIEEHTRQVIDLLNAHGGKLNESLARLATEAGKKQKETLDMVESIIAGQSTFASRIAELEATRSRRLKIITHQRLAMSFRPLRHLPKSSSW